MVIRYITITHFPHLLAPEKPPKYFGLRMHVLRTKVLGLGSSGCMLRKGTKILRPGVFGVGIPPASDENACFRKVLKHEAKVCCVVSIILTEAPSLREDVSQDPGKEAISTQQRR